ncbi:MAG: radical SAM protein [Verrucomicrobia bacterium]|jgi:MoaA/NifB/PqqE/SkfB family radical SAM enzyme|nr:radical SAM protein [Verrucomicrobiota bacterium]
MSILRQATTVLGARLGYVRPLYVHYGVTHRCNMQCRMCVVWKEGNAAEELAPAAIRPMADGLVEAGVRMVTLGGGEPFVRRDLPDVVAAFHERGSEVRILTNGIGPSDEQIDAVIAAGARHVSISLDSLDPAKEQDIYGGKDVWNDIVDTMRRFRQRLQTPPSVPIMNVCVSRLNLDELAPLVAFAADEGFCCSFVPISLSPSEAESDGFAAADSELAVRPQDHAKLDDAYAQLLKLKRQGAPIANTRRFLRDSREFLRSGRYGWCCDAGTLYFSISPQGGISICHHFPPVAQHDTPDLARHLTSKAVRQSAVSTRKQCAGCMRPCWAELTHAVHDLGSSVDAFRLIYQTPRQRIRDGKEL